MFFTDNGTQMNVDEFPLMSPLYRRGSTLFYEVEYSFQTQVITMRNTQSDHTVIQTETQRNYPLNETLIYLYRHTGSH